MSSKKAERRDDTTTAEIDETATAKVYSPQHQQSTVNRALDESRDNIRTSIDEARKQIPHYTQTFNEYQEQTIEAAREMADNYIESQREIINLMKSALLPQIDAANRVVTSNWTSPRHVTEYCARLASVFADNIIVVTKLVNNAMFANLEAFKRSVQTARDNVKEFSRIGVNNAKTFELVSREDTTAATTTFSQ